MPTLSLITPIYAPEPAHLHAAYASVAGQSLPEGWDLEWLVQEDGGTNVAREVLPSDTDFIRFGTGRRGGVAITRNLALSQARGELVRNFDQDDILTPGALERDIEVMTRNPDVGWTTSRVLDLMPDGSTVGFDNDPPAGQLEPGFVIDHWRSHNFRLPVHPTTICIRRSVAVALGGWMAVPGSDDTGLLVAASVITEGWFRSEVGLLYRKWEGQGSASTAHNEPTEWNNRMSLISERAEQLAALWRHRVAS